MFHQGQKVADVAQAMAVSTITIYKWFERFREAGIDGLVNQPKGRPPRKDHLEEETGMHLHVNYLSVLMKQQGFVYRRPKYDLTDLQDPDAREQAKELIDELKKRRSLRVKSNLSLWTKPS